MTTPVLTIILEIPLVSLRGSILDLTPKATARNYRFMDCVEFVENKVLRLYESPELPPFPYAAISYVWRGNPADPATLQEHGSFQVEGALDGDPIGIEAFNHACLASLQKKSSYLWLDRLCILQGKQEKARDDKKWQISRMYQIYKLCSICIILPGGLQRLVPLDEETMWIDRAWTLQETLAPNNVMVLFTHYEHYLSLSRKHHVDIVLDIVVPNQSALSSVTRIAEHHFLRGVEVFGHQDQRSILLAESLRRKELPSEIDPISRYSEIWKSTQRRISSRPVDAVFSIMGLLGITLDVGKFGERDRFRATIALAREILHKSDQRYSSLHIPLWKMPNLLNISRSPRNNSDDEMPVLSMVSLEELTEMMDADDPDILSSDPTDRYIGYDDPNGFLAETIPYDIATTISNDMMLQAYNCNGSERVFATVGDGIVVELCQDLMQDVDVNYPMTIFGWSITHSIARKSSGGEWFMPADDAGFPTVTFYKFDITRSFQWKMWKELPFDEYNIGGETVEDNHPPKTTSSISQSDLLQELEQEIKLLATDMSETLDQLRQYVRIIWRISSSRTKASHMFRRLARSLWKYPILTWPLLRNRGFEDALHKHPYRSYCTIYSAEYEGNIPCLLCGVDPTIVPHFLMGCPLSDLESLLAVRSKVQEKLVGWVKETRHSGTYEDRVRSTSEPIPNPNTSHHQSGHRAERYTPACASKDQTLITCTMLK